VAFSLDGKLLASGSGDKTIKLWNAQTGTELRTLSGHSQQVRSVVFSPDGTRLASGSGDQTIKLWDTQIGSELCTLAGHSHQVHAVVFSPDGSRLASGSEDKTIKLWNARKKTELRTLTGHSRIVRRAVFSSDGSRLFGQYGKDTWLAWNPETSQQVAAPAESPDFDDLTNRTPNGKWLAMPSGKHIRLVDLTFNDDPDERAYREFKANLDSEWHLERSREAMMKPRANLVRSKFDSLWANEPAREVRSAQPEWYAVVFHSAWVLQREPESATMHDVLHSAYEQWKQDFTRRQASDVKSESASPMSNNPDDYLAPLVRKILKLPRGSNPPQSPREPAK
jgi:hypothetical protein